MPILSTLAAAALFASPAITGGEAETFDCTGQVAVVCGDSPQRFMLLQDEGVRFSLNRSFWLEHPESYMLKSGDIVHITGEKRIPTGIIKDEQPLQSAFVVTNLVTVRHGRLPEPAKVEANEINGGRLTGKFVSVCGVASSAMRDDMNPQWNWLIIRTPCGDVYVALTDHEHPLESIIALTDAEVRVSGLMHKQHRWRRFSGPYLMAAGENAVETMSPPPGPERMRALRQSDFGAEAFVIKSLEGALLHRAKTEGVLVALGRGFCFVELQDGRLLKAIPRLGASVPARGTAVTAAGFVTLDFGGLQFSDAEFWPNGNGRPAAATKAEPTKMKELFRQARNPDVSAASGIREIISVSGTIANSGENIRMSRTIRVESDGYSVNADLSTLSDEAIAELDRGCVVQVSGVCNAEFEAGPTTTAFPTFAGFSIFPVSDDAITVVARPSWWTTGRLLVLVLSLVGLLAVFLVLTIVLKTLADRRGQQLYDEKAAHIRTEAKVEERTRLAIELHDAISQTLTGVALQIDSADMADSLNNSPRSVFLATARQMLASCRRELRNCLWDLKSRTFDEKDMTEAVNRAIVPHIGSAKAMVRFNVPRSMLSEPTTHSVLSMVRELVVNAIRHGKAKSVWIAGECSNGRISFSVRDDGCGFDMASAPGPREGHFGLQGIRERVNAANGSIEVESAPGEGTKITISISEGNHERT